VLHKAFIIFCILTLGKSFLFKCGSLVCQGTNSRRHRNDFRLPDGTGMTSGFQTAPEGLPAFRRHRHAFGFQTAPAWLPDSRRHRHDFRIPDGTGVSAG
jgi:hypothetical protein